MFYEESPRTSAEYLRLALPLIAYELGANPVNYAVMYECVSGVNAPLKVAIDAELRNGGALDRETSEALFKAHVMPDAERLCAMQSQIRALLGALEIPVSAAGDDANRFSERRADVATRSTPVPARSVRSCRRCCSIPRT